MRAALVAAGAERLYTHQAEAINAALAGQNVVVATSTASGKTLCFNVPVLEALARDPLARALYLYPTKALAQDQLGKWQALVKGAGDGIVNPLAATYDGDTPQGARARIRKTARVLLTNPDMLHAGILPNHPLWAEFFRHLKYVVIDEAHTYRGVFGSQVACVLRRLRRVCAVYQGAGDQGSGVRRAGQRVSDQPSAISHPHIAIRHPLSAIVPRLHRHLGHHRQPGRALRAADRAAGDGGHRRRLAARATHVRPVEPAVRGSREDRPAQRQRRGQRPVHRAGERRACAPSPSPAPAWWPSCCCATPASGCGRRRPRLVERIAAYRAGYLAEERRRIERELFGGKLLGVTATTALELGIDVGGLDAALLVGYPGTIASLWQQAGRAGRGDGPGAGVLIGLDNPLDQYYMRHPDELLGRPHENALLDPDNVYILQRHLPCAAHEAPLRVRRRRPDRSGRPVRSQRRRSALRPRLRGRDGGAGKR